MSQNCMQHNSAKVYCFILLPAVHTFETTTHTRLDGIGELIEFIVVNVNREVMNVPSHAHG